MEVELDELRKWRQGEILMKHSISFVSRIMLEPVHGTVDKAGPYHGST